MSRQRLRDLGISIGQFEPGPWNAITDIAGARVGHLHLIPHDHTVTTTRLSTGVTAVSPRSEETIWAANSFAGIHSFNGYGEMTGMAWIDEAGILDSPIL